MTGEKVDTQVRSYACRKLDCETVNSYRSTWDFLFFLKIKMGETDLKALRGGCKVSSREEWLANGGEMTEG